MFRTIVYPVPFIVLFFASSFALAQRQSPWKAHDTKRPHPPVVVTESPRGPVAPPSDAIILFDGSDLDQWESADGSPAKWSVRGNAMISTPGSGPVQTRQRFGDVQLHVEWAAPTPPEGKSQGRGNSGIFLMGRYELQVLDSFENQTYADGQAAAVYGQNPPAVNASRPPGQWQTYDIVFRRPRFGSDGSVRRRATITVFHNGVLVQDHFQLWGGTSWLAFTPYERHADSLPLSLQDHGNPVRFRNLWVRPLQEVQHYDAPGESHSSVQLTEKQLERLAGTYQGEGETTYRIRPDHGALLIDLNGRSFELVPVTPTMFELKRTDVNVKFHLRDGRAESVVFNVMGDLREATRVEASQAKEPDPAQ